MSFLLISNNDRVSATVAAQDRDFFRANALEIRMYYVPEGETILITRGQDALLMEEGSAGHLEIPPSRRPSPESFRGGDCGPLSPPTLIGTIRTATLISSAWSRSRRAPAASIMASLQQIRTSSRSPATIRPYPSNVSRFCRINRTMLPTGSFRGLVGPTQISMFSGHRPIH